MCEQRRIRTESPSLDGKRTSKSHSEKFLFLTKTSLLYLESRMPNVNNNQITTKTTRSPAHLGARFIYRIGKTSRSSS